MTGRCDQPCESCENDNFGGRDAREQTFASNGKSRGEACGEAGCCEPTFVEAAARDREMAEAALAYCEANGLEESRRLHAAMKATCRRLYGEKRDRA